MERASDPFYEETAEVSGIPPTAVGGCFRSFLKGRRLRDNGRFEIEGSPVRKDLNEPPTAVGGICRQRALAASRKNLNEPPTAVGGIFVIYGTPKILSSCLSDRPAKPARSKKHAGQHGPHVIDD